MKRFGLGCAAVAATLCAGALPAAGSDADWKEYVYPKQGIKFSLPKNPEVKENAGSFAAIGEMSDCIALVMVLDHPAGKLKDHEDEEFDRLVTALGKGYQVVKDRKVKVDDKHLGRSLTMANEKTEKLLRLFVIEDRVLVIQVTGIKGFLKTSKDLRRFVQKFDLLK